VRAGAVIGRDDEVDRVEAFLDEVAGRPAALVLSGEAGIGKTILWQIGVEEARRQFPCVLTCGVVEAEAALSFAGLSELFGEALVEFADSLLPPRRRALEVALLLAEPGDGPPDGLALALAVHDLLGVLAQRGPVLVAVDDAQWLDPTSAGILEVALKRLRREPVGLLATVRRTRGSATLLGLERSLPEERVTTLSVGPLSLGALHRLLSRRLGLELTRTELARLQDVSGGNPYFALELGRELVRTQAIPAAGRSMRVPESLRELLGGRLAALPADMADVLLEVSALARPTVELVAAADGDLERVKKAISAAAAEKIVELDDSRVRFAHPLLASICYESAPVWKRRAVHRALARVVSDIEERARHLALGAEGPDVAAAHELDRAAERAAGRGATAAAAELCELAVGLVPEDPSSARRRRLYAARYYRLAGAPERAAAILEEVLPEATPGTERADALFELIATLRGGRKRTKELCEEALREAADDDARAVSILVYQAGFLLWAAEVPAALEASRSLLALAERSGDPRLLAAAIARLGVVESFACEITPGLLERGAEIEERLELELHYGESPRYALARLRMRRGEISQARTMLEGIEAQAAARGDEDSRVMVLWPLSMLEWVAGRWQRSLDHAAAAYELGAQHTHGRVWVGRMKALIEADLGLEDDARASAEEAIAFAGAEANEFAMISAQGVLGRIALARGEIDAAAGHLRELPGRLLAGGLNDPTFPVWADAIETLIATGELELARSYLDSFERYSTTLGSPLGMAGAERCRALLAAASGDLRAGLATLERSLAQPERLPPLERGRTLLVLGTLRRRDLQKKAGREALDEAAAIFQQLGAVLWLKRTRAELARVSGRRGAGDDLTETERRVAAMAAEGLSNKQIAAELFMGLSTVEAHLSHVYRKLGIRSRAGLGKWLATEGSGAAKAVAGTPQT
jgi:DNA-binding CsgD family transcriptional regulator